MYNNDQVSVSMQVDFFKSLNYLFTLSDAAAYSDIYMYIIILCSFRPAMIFMQDVKLSTTRKGAKTLHLEKMQRKN